MKHSRKIDKPSPPSTHQPDKNTAPEVIHLNDIITDGKKEEGSNNEASQIAPDYSAELPLWREEILADLNQSSRPAVPLSPAPPQLALPNPNEDKTKQTAGINNTKAKLSRRLTKSNPPLSATKTHQQRQFFPSRHYFFNNFNNYRRLINRYLPLALLLAATFYLAIMYGRIDAKIPHIAELIAVPVLYVDGKIITYGELRQEKIIAQKLNQLVYRESPANLINEQLVKEIIIENAILRRTAEKYKITITAEQQEQIWRGGQNKFANEPAMNKYIADNFKFSPADYKKYVVAPILLRLAVYNALNNDPLRRDEVLRITTDIKNQVEAGKIDFALAAQQYSQDEATRALGGDLGWYARGTLPEEFETALTKMKIGEISEPVRSIYGYHLINLLGIERDTAKQIKNYHAAHILRKTFDYDKWLQQQRAELTIVELMRFN